MVPEAEGAEAPSWELLAEALEANRQLSELADGLMEDCALLREQVARLSSGMRSGTPNWRSSALIWLSCKGCCSGDRRRSRARSRPAAVMPLVRTVRGRDRGSGTGRKRGPGARAGRRDYSRLPRFEVFWDFPGGGYCCPECGEPFTPLGDHWSGEQVDWQVVVRLVAHCRRRYRRACDCRVPSTVMAPGPPKAIGKGLFTNGFIAMLLTERFAAGRSVNSLVTGLGRQGAEISPATLAGTCAQAGALLAPLAEAITARSRESWHLHADETTWRVFAPRDGDGPAKWWLWVFLGPDTVCFVMDATRSGAVLARHAGIDEETGQLTEDADGGPRRLVISSDFYKVFTSPRGRRRTAWSTCTAGPT